MRRWLVESDADEYEQQPMYHSEERFGYEDLGDVLVRHYPELQRGFDDIKEDYTAEDGEILYRLIFALAYVLLLRRLNFKQPHNKEILRMLEFLEVLSGQEDVNIGYVVQATIIEDLILELDETDYLELRRHMGPATKKWAKVEEKHQRLNFDDD